VICHVNPHHGAITNKSYIWAEYVISFSLYPSINIISSNPELKDGKPSLKLIEKYVSYIERKPLSKKKYYDNYYCVSHNIGCNYNSTKYNYLSYSEGYVMPVFVTYDSYSEGYRIIVNLNGITLTDDIEITKFKKRDTPLYVLDTKKTFEPERELNILYIYYLVLMYIKECDYNYNKLIDLNINKNEINIDNIKKIMAEISKYFTSLESSLRMKKINDDIYNIAKNSIQFLKLDDYLKRFLKLTVDLKHPLEAPKDFLNYIFEKDNEWKSKIGKYFKNYEKEVLVEKEYKINKGKFELLIKMKVNNIK